MEQAVLWEVADGEVVGLDDLARIRFIESGEHLEQRRLASPIRAAQAHPVATRQLPRDVVEQDAVAEGLGESGQLEHDL